MTGKDLVDLVIKFGDENPMAFADCDWNLLTTEDWVFLLTCYLRPNCLTEMQFVDFCPWDKFDEEQTYDLVYYRPEFADRANWGCLSSYKVETLIEKHPCLYQYKVLFI